MGCQRLGLDSRPSELPKRQALAAAGQIHLMKYYDDFFTAIGIVSPGAFLTSHCFSCIVATSPISAACKIPIAGTRIAILWLQKATELDPLRPDAKSFKMMSLAAKSVLCFQDCQQEASTSLW